jgi:proline dehydrogenase
MRRYGMRLGAARFVAGEDLDACMAVLRRLNERGLLTNTTILGEGVTSEAVARVVGEAYMAVLDRIAAERLQTNVALKLTHLGLDLGEDLAYRHATQIVRHASQLGNFVRIDMEESTRVDATLRICRRLRAEGYDRVGVALQASLYRTDGDLSTLLPLAPNVSQSPGAWRAPSSN